MAGLPVMFAQDDYSNFDLAALRRQDSSEFERLYKAFAPHLNLYLIRICAQRELAQDVVQETFVKAYRALPRTQSDLQLRPWLYKIATNQLRSSLRLAHLRRVLPFSDQPAAESLPAPGVWESRQAEIEMVEHALAALKPEFAAALLLHWREGFSIEELCDILNLKPGSP